MEGLEPIDPASRSLVADEVASQLTALRDAIASGKSRVSCLRRWSEFIRARDGNRCVDCGSAKQLAAHHICRKSFIADAQFDTGNGITLCRACHKAAHAGFNGRPDLAMPVDAQGGEKLGVMERLYSILVDDAVERQLMQEELYFLSDALITFLKRMQGSGESTDFPGSRIEQAYLILAETERHVRYAVAQANGFAFPDRPLLPGGIMLVLEDDERANA